MQQSVSGAWSDRPLVNVGIPDGITVERRWLPDDDGALTTRVAYTNAAHAVAGLGAPGFDWGSDRPGSYDLALNVLEVALRRLGHAGPRSGAGAESCFTLALLLRGRFVSQVITTLPADGARIDAAAIDAWIAEQVAGLDATQAAMIAPRYALTDGDPRRHWSLAEAEELLGERLSVHAGSLVTAAGTAVAHVVDPHPLSAASWETHPL
jgi:hypothetical protein